MALDLICLVSSCHARPIAGLHEFLLREQVHRDTNHAERFSESFAIWSILLVFVLVSLLVFKVSRSSPECVLQLTPSCRVLIETLPSCSQFAPSNQANFTYKSHVLACAGPRFNTQVHSRCYRYYQADQNIGLTI